MRRPAPVKRAPVRRYNTAGRVTFARQNNLDHVLDITRTYHWQKRVRSWAELFGEPHERQAKQRAKDLFERMLELIFEDLLKGDCFIFPERDFGFLTIADLDRFMDTDHYTYDLRYDGKTYGTVVVLSKLMRSVIGGKRYFLVPTQRNMKRIRDLRERGMRW